MTQTEIKITELFKKLQPMIAEVNDWLKADDFAYQRVKWDIESLDEKRNKIREDLSSLEQQIQMKREQADSIMAMAKEEAEKIMNFVREKNVEAEKLRAQAKIELDLAMEKKYKKERAIA